MRSAQKDYFKMRSFKALAEARRLEGMVDVILQEELDTEIKLPL